MKKKTRWIVKTICVAAAAAALFFVSYRLMNSRTFQLFGALVSRVNTQEKVVALTFDDGPSERTDEILGILHELDVKATFFLVGSSIAKFPEETKRITEAGDEIGNHTYSHNPMVFRSMLFISGEIEKTDALIRQAGYRGEILFRPPNCKKLILLPYYLMRHGRTTITWDLEPNSYPDVDSSPDNIVKYVLDNAKPGSIILLHVMYDSQGHSIGAIPGIVDGLRAKGYTFVTVSDLLNFKNK